MAISRQTSLSLTRVRTIVRMRTLTIYALILTGCCCGLDKLGNSGSPAPSPASAGKTTTATTASVTTVSLSDLLSDYKGNEVRADGKYKGKTIQVTGIVDDVKKDITGDPYVTVGSGAAFEIPQVQCTAGSNQTAAFANLNKGQKVTVQGEVDGLMMNVLLSDCVIK
jgi:hypothetical protein